MTSVGRDPGSLDEPEGAHGYHMPGELRTPKLVVVAVVWGALGAVALLTALLMGSAAIAVFGVLCALAAGALYLGQQAREQFQREEAAFRADPHSALSDEDGLPEDTPTAEDDRGTGTGEGARRDDDDIVDAEYTEYFDYVETPADQDDGTGYDEEERAFQRWQADRAAREAERTDDDEPEQSQEEKAQEEGSQEEGSQEKPPRETPGSADPDAWLFSGTAARDRNGERPPEGPGRADGGRE